MVLVVRGLAAAAPADLAAAAVSVGEAAGGSAVRGNESSTHSATVHAKITVPASFRKTEARSHIIFNVPRRLGSRYGGSSKISGMRRPFTAVRPSTPADSSVITVANPYMSTIS